jgi:low affinity Fe/Cu permease
LYFPSVGCHVQCAQKNTEALQVKLDELIRAVEKADDTLLDLEELEEEELAILHSKYVSLARVARERARTAGKGE